MSEFFSSLLGSLPAVAASPLALVALIVLILAATFLFWKQSSFRSLAKTMEALPERDRIERIRIDYGVRPKRGISAQTWLTSRRQEFLFCAYLSTLLIGLLAFIVVYGKLAQLPGGAHASELRKSFAVLSDKLAAYELAARNMRDAFVLAGENAIGPDRATALILSERIEHYNATYDDLRTQQKSYLEPVLRWLDARPDLSSEVNGVMQYAMQDLHQACLLQFNEAAFRRMEQIRTLPDATKQQEIPLIRAQGALEIQVLGSKANTLLDVLAQRMHTLSAEILGKG